MTYDNAESAEKAVRELNGNFAFSSMQLFYAFAGNNQNYRPRCCERPDALLPEAARPRAIVDQVVHSTEGAELTVASTRHEISVLLSNQ